MEEIVLYMQARLDDLHDTNKAAWLENYVKHDIRSRGVGIPAIREMVNETEQRFRMAGKTLNEQKAMLDQLMASSFTEDKLAAIIYMQIYWKEVDPNVILNLVSSWFDRNCINDWNVCDWLCVRILTPITDSYPEIAINEFSDWNQSRNLWKARASLVPFAQCKNLVSFSATIRNFSIELIKREERFCKTAVGWIMREFSRIDSQFVTEFLERYKYHISSEVRKNATKYLIKAV